MNSKEGKRSSGATRGGRQRATSSMEKKKKKKKKKSSQHVWSGYARLSVLLRLVILLRNYCCYFFCPVFWPIV